jgi:O-antigen ligase
MICGVTFLLGFRRFPILKLFLPIYVLGALVGFIVLFGGDTIQRFQSASMMGRDLLWGVMETYLDAHPWFGVGIGNQQLLISDRISLLTGGTIAAHNEYFRIAVELGYPGSIVFFLLTLWILFNVWISPWVQRDPVFLVTALSFLIYCMTDNAFGAPEIFLILTGASFGATLKRSTASSSVDREPLLPGRRTPTGTLPAARP